MKKRNILLLLLIVLSIPFIFKAVVSYVIKSSNPYAQPVNKLNLQALSEEEGTINSYLQTNFFKDYQCVHKMFGYDSQYYYIKAYCKKHPTVDITTELFTTLRIKYDPVSKKILEVQEPQSGALYQESYQKLFPEEIFVIDTETNDQVVEELKAKMSVSAIN